MADHALHVDHSAPQLELPSLSYARHTDLLARWEDPEAVFYNYLIPLAMRFRMHPWDVDKLTIGEFELYSTAVDEMKRIAERDAKDARRSQRKR